MKEFPGTRVDEPPEAVDVGVPPPPPVVTGVEEVGGAEVVPGPDAPGRH